jgi:hypothetical protein
VLLALASTLASLLLAELGYRVVLRLQGRPYDARAARATIVEAVSRLNDTIGAPAGEVEVRRTAYHAQPYYGVESFGIQGQIEDNLKQPRKSLRAGRPSPYWILLTGGSVAQDFGRRGMHALIQRLQADPRFGERGIRVLFFGQAGMKQPQQLTLLAYCLALGLHVDAVINLDGFNELALANDNLRAGAQPAYPYLPFWVESARSGNEDRYGLDRLLEGRRAQKDAEALARWATGWNVFASSVLGQWTVWRMRRIERRAAAAQAEYAEHHAGRDVIRVGGQEYDRALLGPRCAVGDAIPFLVDCWTTCSRAMRVLCEDRSIAYLHVLQPTLHDPGSKPLTAEEIAKSRCDPAWEEAVRVGYAQLRTAGARLRASGMHFLDASLLFKDVDETLYYDHCHFVEKGHLPLADAIAGSFLEMLPDVLPQPAAALSPVRWSSTHAKARRFLDGVSVYVCMPDGEVAFDVPADAREVRGWFGMLPVAYEHGGTDGVLFTVELDPGAGRGPVVLFQRALDPSAQEEDRGLLEFDLELPAHAGGTLVLRTSNEPERNDLADASFWSDPDFR